MRAAELTQTGVFLGNDLSTLNTHVIPAESPGFITVDVSNTGLQAIDPAKTMASTRSRYAQLGVEVTKEANIPLGAAIANTSQSEVQLPVVNHSLAPVELEIGEVLKVMTKNGPPLSGDPLLDLIDAGHISMGGEEGIDWQIAEGNDGTPLGVALFVRKPETYIPARRTSIRPTGPTTKTFRAEMASHFRPIKPGVAAPIGISETHGSLFTSPDLIALLEQQTKVAEMPGVHVANSRQINSPALYGGYPPSPWPIRTELLNSGVGLNGGRDSFPKTAVIATFYNVLNRKH